MRAEVWLVSVRLPQAQSGRRLARSPPHQATRNLPSGHRGEPDLWQRLSVAGVGFLYRWAASTSHGILDQVSAALWKI